MTEQEQQDKERGLLNYQKALAALIRFGAQGEMLGYGIIQGGDALIFLTVERHAELPGRRAFLYYNDNVLGGAWVLNPETDSVDISWEGVGNKTYPTKAFKLNPYCVPPPSHGQSAE